MVRSACEAYDLTFGGSLTSLDTPPSEGFGCEAGTPGSIALSDMVVDMVSSVSSIFVDLGWCSMSEFRELVCFPRCVAVCARPRLMIGTGKRSATPDKRNN